MKSSYSQIGQDKWVVEKTKGKRNGYFIEIGAVDGVYLSNTYLLETQYGWTGVCIEPSSKYGDLIKNRSSLCFPVCLSDKAGEVVEFVEGTTEKWGTDESHHTLSGIQKYFNAHQTKGITIKLRTRTLEDVLIAANAPTDIDYMSIDTEGSELIILKNFPFNKYKIKLITIEHSYVEPQRTLIRELLTKNGYKHVHQLNIDDCFELIN
jgi:FkbM family methyltransferase